MGLVTLTLPFDLETGRRVAPKVGNLPSKFGHARPLGSRIIRYVRDGRTDGRTDGWTKATLIAPFPTGTGIINSGVSKLQHWSVNHVEPQVFLRLLGPNICFIHHRAFLATTESLKLYCKVGHNLDLGMSIFAARCYASAALAIMSCLLVCPSIYHVRGFCQNE